MNTNSIAFIALANEYCSLVENPYEFTPSELLDKTVKTLSRIYITAFDINVDDDLLGDTWVDQALDEEQYDSVRSRLAAVFGSHDVYLEVFEEDMKYSDTPVAASISENLADIYQVMFDFVNTAKFGTEEVTLNALAAVKNSFREYWSATLCNVLRALNNLWQHDLLSQDNE